MKRLNRMTRSISHRVIINHMRYNHAVNKIVAVILIAKYSRKSLSKPIILLAYNSDTKRLQLNSQRNRVL